MKQGDNALGSIHPSVHVFICALSWGKEYLPEEQKQKINQANKQTDGHYQVYCLCFAMLRDHGDNQHKQIYSQNGNSDKWGGGS